MTIPADAPAQSPASPYDDPTVIPGEPYWPKDRVPYPESMCWVGVGARIRFGRILPLTTETTPPHASYAERDKPSIFACESPLVARSYVAQAAQTKDSWGWGHADPRHSAFLEQLPIEPDLSKALSDPTFHGYSTLWILRLDHLNRFIQQVHLRSEELFKKPWLELLKTWAGKPGDLWLAFEGAPPEAIIHPLWCESLLPATLEARKLCGDKLSGLIRHSDLVALRDKMERARHIWQGAAQMLFVHRTRAEAKDDFEQRLASQDANRTPEQKAQYDALFRNLLGPHPDDQRVN